MADDKRPEVARIKLQRPLKTYGDDIRELILREPRGATYMRLGNPQRRIFEPTNGIGGKGRFEFVPDPASVMGYLEDMTGVEPMHLEGLSVRDLIRAENAVLSYFGEALIDALADPSPGNAETSSERPPTT